MYTFDHVRITPDKQICFGIFVGFLAPEEPSLPDAVVTEDVVEDDFSVQKVGS